MLKVIAILGNENFIRLRELKNKYGFSNTVIASIHKNYANYTSGDSLKNLIKKGLLKLDETDYAKIEKILAYLYEFKDVQKKIGGSQNLFFTCLAWCYSLPNVDSERLKISIFQQTYKILPVAKTEETLRQFSEVYNYGYSKKNIRAFDYEWKTKGLN